LLGDCDAGHRRRGQLRSPGTNKKSRQPKYHSAQRQAPDEQKVSEKANQSFVLQYGITYPDVKRIRATIPGVTIVLPARNIRDYVWNISHRVDCEVVGTVPWYPEMRNHHVNTGRFFNEADMDEKTSVCVLGAEMAPILFPLESPLGKHVRVGASIIRSLASWNREVARPG